VIHFAGNPQRQPRLADSANTNQCNQARITKKSSDVLHLSSAPNEARYLCGEVTVGTPRNPTRRDHRTSVASVQYPVAQHWNVQRALLSVALQEKIRLTGRAGDGVVRR
jgi:hypothetical protein